MSQKSNSQFEPEDGPSRLETVLEFLKGVPPRAQKPFGAPHSEGALERSIRSVTLLLCLLLVPLPLQAAEGRVAIQLHGQLAVRWIERTTTSLTGRVLDDNGTPVSEARVSFGDTPSKECGAPPPEPARTNAEGEFCVELLDPSATSTKLVVSHPHHRTTTRLLIELEALDPLRIVSAPRALELTQAAPFDFVLDRPRFDQSTNLILRCGSRQELLATVEPSDAARISGSARAPEALDPGPCELQAEQGSAQSPPWPVALTAVVELRLVHREESEDQIHLTVQAERPGHPVEQGAIEFVRQGRLLQTTPLDEDGFASLTLHLDSEPAEALASYLPASPYLLSGSTLSLHLPSRTLPSPPFVAPGHWIALASFGTWFAWAWFRRGARREAPPPAREGVAASLGPSTGPLSGQILDGHTGAPLAHAELLLFRTTPTVAEPLELARSEKDGRFRFALVLPRDELMKIRVKSPGYRTLESPVLGRDLQISLIQLRRAFIERFVDWARTHGHSEDTRGAPTPLHVAASAEALGSEEVADWARQINEHAYGVAEPTDDDLSRTRSP